MFKTLLCEGMFCTNNIKFILIASVVIVNISISAECTVVNCCVKNYNTILTLVMITYL